MTLTVGALGPLTFEAGWYAYTGSAMGPGGLARVDRHHDVATGRNDTRHWHLDDLLGESPARIDAVTWARGRNVECPVSRAIDGEPVPAFGASDCGCVSHLQYRGRRTALLGTVEAAYASASG